MKKIPALVFLGLAFMHAPLQAAGDSVSSQTGNTSAELASTMQQLQQVQLLQADFRQHKNLRILRHPFISSGRLVFSKKHGLYWKITEPLPGIYLINNKGIKAINEDGSATKTATESPFADNIGKLFSGILGGNLQEMETYFDVAYNGHAAQWKISLQPNNRHIGRIIDSIEVSGGRYINHIQIRETGGDVTGISFSNMVEESAGIAETEAEYFQ